MATVGEASVQPGASNVIPGEANLSVDLRHPNDEIRERLRDHLKWRAGEIAASRGCGVKWHVRQETPAVRMDQDLSGLLGEAVKDTIKTVHQLPSGAGHDAAPMAALTPVSMLFVRCEEGISHNPAESITKEDVDVAIEVMSRFLKLVSKNAGAEPIATRSRFMGEEIS